MGRPFFGGILPFVVNKREARGEWARVLHKRPPPRKTPGKTRSGQRGYVITGQPEYLGPYHDAVGSINAQMDALARLIAGDPVHEGLMVDVRRRVGAKLGELALTIGLRERKGFDLTKEVIALGAGRAEMDALRATVAEMARHEAELLLAREAGADKTYRAALVSARRCRRWPRSPR